MRRGRDVLIVEREAAIGLGISARNSGVIHAGIYYAQGSLKAQLCAAGRDELYRYCAEHGIAHQRCGKLVIAGHANEVERLTQLQSGAARLGVDLNWFDTAQLRAFAPALSGVAALHSPATGIVDVPALMQALLDDVQARGARLVLDADVTAIEPNGTSARVLCRSGLPSLEGQCVVNAAGLDAPGLAATTGPAPTPLFAKGSYFALKGPAPTSCLVYPLPSAGGLGIHLTLDLDGNARFGPDVEWVDAPNYDVHPARADAFYAAIRRYWPGLPDGSLAPAYAGVRPKLAENPSDDFVIRRRDNLIDLLGVESPGLTASLAIGEHVADLIDRKA